MKTIMITDGASRNSLCILRSLAKKGCKIIVASEKEKSLCFYSKFTYKKVVYPTPYTRKKEFVDFILDYIKNNKIDLLIPVSDLTIYPIIEKLEEFKRYTVVALPSKEVLDKTFDKEKTLKIAQKIGVPIPETYYIKEIAELKELSEKLNYPVVLKPRLSRYWKGNEMVHGFRKFVYSKDELIKVYKELDAEIPRPLIQEFVYGDGYGVFIIAKEGESLAVFSHKRLREVPMSGGASVLREAIEPPKKLKEYSEKLIKEIKWTGVAMVEFKGEKENPKLMEINGRFWGSIDLAVSSGVNFPGMLYDLYLGNPVEKIKRYNVGHKARYLRGDFEYLEEYLGNKNITLKQKVNFIFEFFNFFKRGISYDNLKLSDPLPGIRENLLYIASKIKKIAIRKKK